jgi:hypothetical protein
MSLDHHTGDLFEEEKSNSLNHDPTRSSIDRDEIVEANDDALLTSKKGSVSGAVETDRIPLSAQDKGIGKRKGEVKWWLGGFLFGFVMGLVLSLTYGWVLDPRPEPVTPATLRPEDKELYLKLIALAFAYDEDEARARSRLSALADSDIDTKLVNLTERYINQENDVRDIMALVSLTRILGQTSSVMLAFVVTPTPLPTATPTLAPTPTPRPTNSPTPLTPVPTPTPTLTPSPSPTQTATRTHTGTATRTPTPTPSRSPTPSNTATPGPDSPFGVAQSVALCENNPKGGLLRIYVRDRLGIGLPGVKLIVTWSGGKDTFFTGFKPEIDPGYADFQMEKGQLYQVDLDNLEFVGETPEITIDNNDLCPDLTDTVAPSWQLVFQQGAN